MQPRIYLDNAATSWPKPEAVYQAVERAMRELGAPAGRSTYREATEVQATIDDTRRRLAVLLGLSEPHNVIFTANGTEALNLALYGLLQPGDHVITTAAEHNSVLRPLKHLEETRHVEVTRVATSSDGVVDVKHIADALRPQTRLVAMTHASNVTGALQPVAAVGKLLKDHPALFLVDAAQSLGHVDCSFATLGCDLLAAPGHKGLLGPLGTGLLALRPGVEQSIASLCRGGTGTSSEDDRHPDALPEKYEAGNLNVPGILGLGAALTFLEERGLQSLRQHELELTAQLWHALAELPAVRLLGPAEPAERVGVVSVQVEGYDPQEFAALLDSVARIQVRAGLHCAPAMHQALGTLTSGGTIRLSLSPFTTSSEIEAVGRAFHEFTGELL